ncbi:MAG: hypothetical protein AAGD38_21645 [Acidobacteriota bacterium]
MLGVAVLAATDVELRWIDAGEPPDTPVTLRFDTVESEDDAGTDRNTDTTARGPTDAPTRFLTASVPGRFAVDLDAGVWRVSVADGPYFVAQQTFYVGPRARTIPVDLQAGGRMVGQVVIPDKDIRPWWIDLTVFVAPPQTQDETELDRSSAYDEYTTRCDIADDLTVDCALPAGRLDLWLRAGEYRSELRWQQRLEPGTTLDLGRLRLERAVAVAGRVLRADGRDISPETVVTLTAEHIARPLIASGPIVDPEPVDIPIGRHGIFVGPPVPRGNWRLSIDQPGHGTPEQKLRLAEPREHRIEPALVMRPLERLSVIVDPPTDAEGKPWQLGLFRLRNEYDVPAEPVTRIEVPPGGWWESEPLDAGLYVVNVARQYEDAVQIPSVAPGTGLPDVRGVGYYARLGKTPMPVTIDMRPVTVDVEVTLGDRPLADAVVSFGGIQGLRPGWFAPEFAIMTATDAEGRAQLELPHRGPWLTRVLADEPFVRVRGLEVTLEPKAGDRAEVRLDLPDTRVAIRVDGVDGEPLDDAQILIRAMDPPGRVDFDFRDRPGVYHGLGPGVIEVGASHRSGRAPPVETVVEPGSGEASVVLTIEPPVVFEGQLSGIDGNPISRAFIALRDDHQRIRTHVRPNGSFRIAWPTRPTGDLGIVVDATDWPLFVSTLGEARPDEPLDLVLPTRQAGTLCIDVETRDGFDYAPAHRLVILRDELVIPLYDSLLTKRQIDDPNERYCIADMAPGPWDVCWQSNLTDQVEQCVGGWLEPLAELELATTPAP